MTTSEAVRPLLPHQWRDANGRTWERYSDPLAPERANPYRWVEGYDVESVQNSVDSTREV